MEQWAADTAAPGEQLGVRCLAQGSHLSRGHGPARAGIRTDNLGLPRVSSPTKNSATTIYTCEECILTIGVKRLAL